MCSLRCIITAGILLAVLDIFQGLLTLGWYGYWFLWDYFYLCTDQFDICHSQEYQFTQFYRLRTYIGIAEGAVTPIFAALYIYALIRHTPWLVWTWLLKAFGILGINVYFLSQWLFRNNRDLIKTIGYSDDYDTYFKWVGIGLTGAEAAILLLFCLIGSFFSYKVFEERRRSRRSLHRIHKMGRGRATAPPLDVYDDEASMVRANIEEQFLNHGLNDSTNKLPLPGSTSSMDEVGQASTMKKAPTQV